MKLLLLSLISLLSCTSYTYKLSTPCKVSNQVIFEKLTGALVSEGLNIKTITSNYLYAESTPTTGKYGALYTHIWTFTVSNDTVTLNAKRRYENEGYKFETNWNNPKTPITDTWYWNVQKEIESICGGKILVIESVK